MNRKIRFNLIKMNKIIIILTIFLSMFFINVKNTEGYHSSQVYPFTVGKEIVYPSWWSQKCPSIPKQWSTNIMYYNDKIAYCMEASKDTPPSGHYAAETIKNNSMVRKLLYYGYGGAGSTKSDGTPILFMANESVENQYLYTHILLSIAYSGDAFGCDLDELEKLGIGLKGLYASIKDMPEPESKVYFSPGIQSGKKASFTAFYNKDTKEQMTNTVKLEGSYNAEIVIPLQEKVTIHNITTGYSQTGGNATVHGGESFYFTAPCTNDVSDDLSKKVDGKGCAPFTALAIHSGGNNQTIGSWDFDSEESELYIDIDWMDFGSLRLSKVDNVSQFQKGSKFRLISTSYNGYDETFEVSKDKDGDYELLIENLPVGTYSLTEVDCEDYFAPTVAQFQISIEKNKITKQVVVNTLRPTGTINVTKKLANASENATDLSKKDITKTSYKLIAKNDIFDTVSLKKLYSKGELVKIGSGKCIIDQLNDETIEYSKGVTVKKGSSNDKGIYNVDENGNLIIEGLPLGKYQIIEQSVSDGHIVDSTPYEFEVKQEDYTTKVYEHFYEQTNEITKFSFTKTDITGEKEIEGALLQIIDENNKVLDEWISGKNAHEIDGLTVGKTYILHESMAPLGYATASDIQFTVKNENKLQEINMIDEIIKVEISKQDKSGHYEVKGAHLTLQDDKGKIIDEWISTNHAHSINGLEVGKTYTLVETQAPEGYKLAQPLSFTVKDTKDVQKVIMYDEKIEIVKTGDDTNIIGWCFTFLAVLVIILGRVYFINMKKNK